MVHDQREQPKLFVARDVRHDHDQAVVQLLRRMKQPEVDAIVRHQSVRALPDEWHQAAVLCAGQTNVGDMHGQAAALMRQGDEGRGQALVDQEAVQGLGARGDVVLPVRAKAALGPGLDGFDAADGEGGVVPLDLRLGIAVAQVGEDRGGRDARAGDDGDTAEDVDVFDNLRALGRSRRR